MEAVADATGLPVDTVAVPEGAALGAAFLARMAAGLESDFGAAGAWARRGPAIEPDPAWAAAARGPIATGPVRAELGRRTDRAVRPVPARTAVGGEGRLQDAALLRAGTGP